jgi:putative aldouronate transport system substrate-binding protein
MLNLHTIEVPNSIIPDALGEKLNVKLDIDWVPNNNYDEKLNTALATSSLPEIVLVGFNQLNQFREAIVDDQFWGIGPYLDQFENLSKLKEPVLENTKIEGKLYGLYQCVTAKLK